MRYYIALPDRVKPCDKNFSEVNSNDWEEEADSGAKKWSEGCPRTPEGEAQGKGTLFVHTRLLVHILPCTHNRTHVCTCVCTFCVRGCTHLCIEDWREAQGKGTLLVHTRALVHILVHITVPIFVLVHARSV